jgi:hypothetical protein
MPDAVKPTSFATDIRPLFAERDIQAMRVGRQRLSDRMA